MDFLEFRKFKNDEYQLKDLQNEFSKHISKNPFWDQVKDKVNLGHINEGLSERFTNAIYPNKLKLKEKEKYVNGDNGKPIEIGGRYVFSEKYNMMKSDIDNVTKFYKNQKSWDTCSHTIYTTSGNAMSNIKNIGVANVLNFLFEDQVDDNYFQNVQYVLFHENTVIVSRDGVLSSLAPSDRYKQFVLKKIDGLDEESLIMMDPGDVQLHRFQGILKDVVQDKTKEFFDNNQSGDTYLDHLRDITKIEFIDTEQQHKLSIGSIYKHEQEAFTKFLKDFSFIFPTKISEMHLSKFDEIGEIPINQKELFFYIEKRKSDRDMDAKYFITQGDIILLGRSSFYTTVLIERAFCVIFNKEILDNNELCSDFKTAIGRKSLDLARKYFDVRSKSISESRLLRKIFVQNGLLFLQGKKDQLSPDMVFFMNSIFHQNQNKQLN